MQHMRCHGSVSLFSQWGCCHDSNEKVCLSLCSFVGMLAEWLKLLMQQGRLLIPTRYDVVSNLCASQMICGSCNATNHQEAKTKPFRKQHRHRYHDTEKWQLAFLDSDRGHCWLCHTHTHTHTLTHTHTHTYTHTTHGTLLVYTPYSAVG